MPLDVIVAVAIRPWLWPTAIGAWFALAPRRWWARRPYVPIPDRDVVRWRTATAYGNSVSDMAPDDVVSYLTWRRSTGRL